MIWRLFAFLWLSQGLAFSGGIVHSSSQPFRLCKSIFQDRILQSFRLNLADNNLITAADDIQAALRNGPVLTTDRLFLINGWRWHTLSVIRDLSRFIALVDKLKTELETPIDRSRDVDWTRICKEKRERLQSAYSFVYQFNWIALQHVERDVFFPWLSDKLPPVARSAIKSISEYHVIVQQLGNQLKEQCATFGSPKAISATRDHSILVNSKSSDVTICLVQCAHLRDTLSQMLDCAQKVQKLQVSRHPLESTAFITRHVFRMILWSH